MGSQFDICAQEYHKFRPEYPESLFQFLVENFSLNKNDLAIDVGCGTARAALPLAARGLRIIGIDPGMEMLRLARDCARAANADMQFVVARAETLAVRDACARLINCAQAFHWFDTQTALAEFARLLLPAGGLAIYWNNRDHARA